jgi:hypothetical protein
MTLQEQTIITTAGPSVMRSLEFEAFDIEALDIEALDIEALDI